MKDNHLSLNEFNVVKRLSEQNKEIIDRAKFEINPINKSLMVLKNNKENNKKANKISNEYQNDLQDKLYEKVETLIHDKIKSNISLIENYLKKNFEKMAYYDPRIKKLSRVSEKSF